MRLQTIPNSINKCFEIYILYLEITLDKKKTFNFICTSVTRCIDEKHNIINKVILNK